MTKRAVFLFLLGVLCVSATLAGTQKQVTYRLDGRNAGGNLFTTLPGTTGGFANLRFAPSPLPDGSRGYYADIYWSEDNSNYHEIYGLVPASAFTFTALSKPLQVNITTALFYDVEGSPVYDSGGFTSLVGTFTPYTGVGNFRRGNSGRNYSIQTHLDGSTEAGITNGTFKAEAATFEGTLVVSSGTYDLSVQGPYPNADLFILTGTQTTVITTP